MEKDKLEEKGIEGKTMQQKKRAFLAAFAEVGTITHAAELAGIHRNAHYDWLKNDPSYPDLFREADQKACEKLEQEARRRAVHGVGEPVFYQGQPVGTVQKYSDTLLIFLLKGALPDKYRERYAAEISGPGGAPIEVTFVSGEDPE